MSDNDVHFNMRSVHHIGATTLHRRRDLIARRARLFSSAVRGGVHVTGQSTAQRRIRTTYGGTTLSNFVRDLPGNCSAPINRLNNTLSNNRHRHVNITHTFLRSTPFLLLSRPASGLSDLGRNIVLGTIQTRYGSGAILLISRHGSAVTTTSVDFSIRDNQLD